MKEQKTSRRRWFRYSIGVGLFAALAFIVFVLPDWNPPWITYRVKRILQELKASNVEKIIVHIDRSSYLDGNDHLGAYDVDVTQLKPRILGFLGESEFDARQCQCHKMSRIEIHKLDGKVVRVVFSDHRFKLLWPDADDGDGCGFSNETLMVFVRGLMLDPSLRIFEQGELDKEIERLRRSGDKRADMADEFHWVTP